MGRLNRGGAGYADGGRLSTLRLVRTTRPSVLEPCSLDGYAYQLDPYVGCEHRCLYCYTQNDCPVDWDHEIGIVPDFISRLSDELAPIEAQTVYMGMNTDPYQPVEAKYGLTRKALELMLQQGFSACVLTRSDLVMRDLGLFKKMADPSVGISVAFNDEATRALFETKTIPARDRIATLGRFKRQGIPTYALVCPVFPMITNIEDLITELGSCADTIWFYRLEMASEEDANWQRILPVLREHYAGILDDFGEIVFNPKHSYWTDLRGRLEDMSSSRRLKLEIRI
jgi:DNA repair photolyase